MVGLLGLQKALSKTALFKHEVHLLSIFVSITNLEAPSSLNNSNMILI